MDSSDIYASDFKPGTAADHRGTQGTSDPSAFSGPAMMQASTPPTVIFEMREMVTDTNNESLARCCPGRSSRRASCPTPIMIQLPAAPDTAPFPTRGSGDAQSIDAASLKSDSPGSARAASVQYWTESTYTPIGLPYGQRLTFRILPDPYNKEVPWQPWSVDMAHLFHVNGLQEFMQPAIESSWSEAPTTFDIWDNSNDTTLALRADELINSSIDDAMLPWVAGINDPRYKRRVLHQLAHTHPPAAQDWFVELSWGKFQDAEIYVSSFMNRRARFIARGGNLDDAAYKCLLLDGLNGEMTEKGRKYLNEWFEKYRAGGSLESVPVAVFAAQLIPIMNLLRDWWLDELPGDMRAKFEDDLQKAQAAYEGKSVTPEDFDDVEKRCWCM